MQRTRIKICGVGRVGDAVLAAGAGADAIGLVFHAGAPRNVSVERAREILDALPAFVTPVGLFVDAGAERVLATARELGLRHVQLHGHETPGEVAALRGLVVLKAIRVERETFRATLDEWRAAVVGGALPHLRGIVLESPADRSGQAGGTGAGNDWETVVACAREGAFDGLPPVIAAGGLSAENVGRVVRDLRPWAVDVSSGVDVVRGEKSLEKMQAFVRAVRDADGG